jgi:hypothetical protein
MAQPGTVTVELVSGDAEPSRALGELRTFSPAERFGRAALVLLAACVAAALIVPVPIVHLVGIPLVLLAGVVAAVRQAMAVARLAPMRIPCPRCGTANSLGGGLGYRTTTGPIARQCESCRRPLELRIQ